MKTQTISESQLREETGGTGVVRRSRLSNILLLILSLLIAFVLWLYVKGTESASYETVFTSVPITILENDDSLSVYYGYSNVVDVTVRGKKSDLDRIAESDVEAIVDITDIRAAGRYTLPVRVMLPSGATLVSQTVSTLSVYLDARSSATVPVTVKIASYQLGEDYEIGTSDISLSVSEITVTGPESVLATIASAQASLQLGQVTSSVVVASDLVLVDAAGEPVTSTYLKMGTTNITATVPVYLTRTLPLEVSLLYGYLNAANSKITVSPSTLRVKGEVSEISRLTSIPLTTLDEKKLVGETLSVPVTLAPGLVNVDNVETATVTVQHIGTVTSQIVLDDIQVNNPNDLRYELLSDSINVTLRGAEMYLDHLMPSDIRAVVDLSYLTSASGSTSVPVSIVFGDSYVGKVYEIGDYKISVKLGE